MKRSGLDYWKDLKLIEHDSYEEFINTIKNDADIYYITRYGKQTPDSLHFKTNNKIYLVFGKESTGIPKSILLKHQQQTVRIPTSVNVRSLNLSNCVAILGYEYIKQNNYDGLKVKEPHKPLK
jgi:tRNA (cytidine/uridine-2'-O-)-methyltransferase